MATLKLCTSCQKELSTDNFHKRKQSKDGFCTKCKDCQSEYYKNWSKDNKGNLRQYHRVWAKENRDIVRKNWSKWHENNREHWNQYQSDRSKKNPEQKNLYTRARYALKKNSAGSHTVSQLKEIRARQNNKCNYCGSDATKGHIDHIIPLTRCGTNYASNLQLLCVSCNTSKSNKMPWEYFNWA
jgi:hypothetical protein